jgi:sodium-dependent dicarboxylate transporter 2/3/5
MLFPLGLAVLAELGRGRGHDEAFRRYALAMMLVTSLATSIGGMATPVGTPPNLIGRRFLSELAGIDLNFAQWIAVGMPIVLIMMAFVAVWFLVPRGRSIELDDEAWRAVAEEKRKLGAISAGERNVVIAFGITVVLWVVPGLLAATLGAAHPAAVRLNAWFPESVAALIGAMLLFVLPVSWRVRKFTLSWEEAARIDWGIILLFGGGLAMGQLADSTGLSASLGRWVAGEFPNAGEIGLTMVFTGVAIVMSEAASNTASANIIVPTAIAVSAAAGISPLAPALGATFGASMGFMLPIATPPNAIVYSSGYLPLGAMLRVGVVLDVVGYFVIVGVVLGMSAFLR